jgi:hypothetical protein
MHTRLACKIDYLLRSNHRDRSIASSFFTDDFGIEIAFSREGRAGSRVIRMRSFPENTVSSVSDSGSGADSEQQP